ncbi:MAG: hypothetical protein JSU95_19105 [Betaproteobacteria bacterium]|nr:MAG: hypothetical protein JSU95_19105 [Betaproteobacteria bacterium]
MGQISLVVRPKIYAVTFCDIATCSGLFDGSFNTSRFAFSWIEDALVVEVDKACGSGPIENAMRRADIVIDWGRDFRGMIESDRIGHGNTRGATIAVRVHAKHASSSRVE